MSCRVFLFSFLFLFTSVSFAQPFKVNKGGVSAGPSVYFTKAVEEISSAGGNIFDSAVAGAFVLSVVTPYFVSLGCGGVALLKDRKEVVALDFREVAPLAMKANFYTQSGLSSSRGGSAVGVPGLVAGLWALHRKYGSLSWKKILKPAIRLAERGFLISGDYFNKTHRYKKRFNRSGQVIFFHSDGTPYLPGEVFKQKHLALALKLLSQSGPSVFYRGPLGKDVVRAVKANQGVMTKKDLKAYKVRWLKPAQWDFFKHRVYGMPFPSSGGLILARASYLMDSYPLLSSSRKLYSVDEWHLLAEGLALAFKPRSQLGDLPNFSSHFKKWVNFEQLKKLSQSISLHRAKMGAKSISNSSYLSDKQKPVLKDDFIPPQETTHISLMNDQGLAVSMTLTLNSNYGSFVVTNKYGIVLNNQMDDFQTRPGRPNQFGLIQGKMNAVRGGRRPLSSMSPVIVEKDGKVILVVGGAGGPMIISSVFQVMVRFLINGLNLDMAVQAPRVHHQFLPSVLYVEKNRFSPLVVQTLRNRGHNIKKRDSIAKVQAVGRGKDGFLHGAFDSRGEGSTGRF